METKAQTVTLLDNNYNGIDPDLDRGLKDIFSRIHPGCTITVGAEAGNEIAVTVQLTKSDGNNYNSKTLVNVWLSDTAGGAETAAAPDVDTVVSGGVSLIEHTADVNMDVISDVNGAFIVTLGDTTGTPTWYLNVNINGEIFSSAAITFA